MIKKDTVEGNETSPICWGHKLEDIVGRGGYCRKRREGIGQGCKNSNF